MTELSMPAVAPRLGRRTREILYFLTDTAILDGTGRRVAYNSAAAIGKELGMMRRSVVRQIKRLEELGYVVVEQGEDRFGRSMPNRYVVLPPPTEE